MRWFNFFHIYQPPAWDEAIIRRVADESYRPVLGILEGHPNLRITMNITGSLTEQLQALGMGDIIDRFRVLIQRGQVELVGSAMYHPILPLLPVAEARRQIELQSTLYRQIFGPDIALRGFYCPEMAYDHHLDGLLLELGYTWIILDEICANGQIGTAAIHRPWVLPSGLRVVFRNRHISDYLSFSSDLANPADGLRAIQEDVRGHDVLITAMDGENLGHHRHGVDRLWEFLATYPGIETDVLSSLATQDGVASRQLVSGSWSSQPSDVAKGIPFALWDHPDNPIHQLQWELTRLIVRTVGECERDPNYHTVRQLVDRVLASDRYWWASASPWWDMAIVIRETQKLADAVAPLTAVPPATRAAIERLVQRLITTVELWERTGLATKRQHDYLLGTGDVRFMAGGRVGT